MILHCTEITPRMFPAKGDLTPSTLSPSLLGQSNNANNCMLCLLFLACQPLHYFPPKKLRLPMYNKDKRRTPPTGYKSSKLTWSTFCTSLNEMVMVTSQCTLRWPSHSIGIQWQIHLWFHNRRCNLIILQVCKSKVRLWKQFSNCAMILRR